MSRHSPRWTVCTHERVRVDRVHFHVPRPHDLVDSRQPERTRQIIASFAPEMRAATLVTAGASLLPLLAAGDGTSETGLAMIDPHGLSILEVILAGFVLIFALNIVQGWRTNTALIRPLISVLDPLLEAEFSKLGTDEKGTRFVKDGACDFVYYATGRRYATGLTAAFELQNRQDMFARAGRLFQASMADRCVITVPLSTDYAMEPVSLLLVRAKELERLRNGGERTTASLAAVEELAGEVREIPSLDGKFHVLADHDGVISTVLCDRILEHLRPVTSGLQSLQLTDSGTGWDSYSRHAGSRFVRLVFDLPVTSEAAMRDTLAPMLATALDLVDMSARLRLPSAARARAVELRKRASAQKQKQRQIELREANEEKRVSKRLAAEQALEKKTAGSAAKQAKALERKRKDELKQRLKKATKK